MTYIVFDPAPSRRQLLEDPEYSLDWTISEYEVDTTTSSSMLSDPSVLDAALSRLSQHVADVSRANQEHDELEYTRSFELDDETRDDSNVSFVAPASQSLEIDDSAITWATSQPLARGTQTDPSQRNPGTQLTPDESALLAGDRTSFLTTFDASGSQLQAEESINFFPTFSFNPARITTLAMLPEPGSPTQTSKFEVLAGVLEMSGPDSMQTKAGPLSLLTMVLGDGSGGVVRLACWRETADEWATQIRRGDVAHFSGLSRSMRSFLSSIFMQVLLWHQREACLHHLEIDRLRKSAIAFCL